MKNFMKKIIALACASLFFSPIAAFSQSIIPPVDPTVGGQLGAAATMTSKPIDQTLDTVANYVIGVLIVIAIFMIIWAGYTFVAHGTDPDAVGKARTRILFAAVGIIVALLAKGIVGLVLSALQ